MSDDEPVEDLWDYEAPKVFSPVKPPEETVKRGCKRKTNPLPPPVIVLSGSDSSNSDTPVVIDQPTATSRKQNIVQNTKHTKDKHTPQAQAPHNQGEVSSIPAVHVDTAQPDVQKKLEETRQLVQIIQNSARPSPADQHDGPFTEPSQPVNPRDGLNEDWKREWRHHSAPPNKPTSPATAEDKRIRITLQCDEDRHVTFLVKYNDQLDKVFAAFKTTAAKKGWAANAGALDAVQFEFDGFALVGDKTAKDMGIEDEDIVNVLGL